MPRASRNPGAESLVMRTLMAMGNMTSIVSSSTISSYRVQFYLSTIV